MKYAALLLAALVPIGAVARDQTPEEMKAEIERTYREMKQADEKRDSDRAGEKAHIEQLRKQGITFATRKQYLEYVRCEAKFNGHAPVEASRWDGEVYQVRRYIESHMKDPDSFDAINWTRLVRGCGSYTVGVTYRGKNSFGGYAVAQEIFTIDAAGMVTSVQRIK